METLFQMSLRAIVAELSKEDALKVLRNMKSSNQLDDENYKLVQQAIERLSEEG